MIGPTREPAPGPKHDGPVGTATALARPRRDESTLTSATPHGTRAAPPFGRSCRSGGLVVSLGRAEGRRNMTGAGWAYHHTALGGGGRK